MSARSPDDLAFWSQQPFLTQAFKVNGSNLDCHFNELTIDHKHVKYQSVANSSLFLGFDGEGNPVCGRSSGISVAPTGTTGLQEYRQQTSTTTSNGTGVAPAAEDPNAFGVDSCERCFLFTKMKRLTTSTLQFPEALELIADNSNGDEPAEAADDEDETTAVVTSAGRRGQELKNHEGGDLTALRLLESAEAATASRRRASFATATATIMARRSFEQRRLINMDKYRNILRYLLGRSAGQSIVPERGEANSERQKLATARNGIKVGSNSKKSSARRQGGRQRKGKPRSPSASAGKSRRQVSVRSVHQRPRSLAGATKHGTTCKEIDDSFENSE